MKLAISISFLIFCSAIAPTAVAQYNWKLTKNNDGIKVYQSSTSKSAYKSIKVECTLVGNYDKLLTIITNVSHHKDWVYNNKTATLLKNVSPLEFYYYTETSLPWPMSNRDVVMHTQIERDSLNRFLTIHSVDDPGLMAAKAGKVRVHSSKISWYVTMPSTNTLHIVYTFEADPGGGIPGWMVNSFADKGPYESFKKLGEMLKQ